MFGWEHNVWLLGISKNNDNRITTKEHFTDESIFVNRKSFLLAFSSSWYLLVKQIKSPQFSNWEEIKIIIIIFQSIHTWYIPQSTSLSHFPEPYCNVDQKPLHDQAISCCYGNWWGPNIEWHECKKHFQIWGKTENIKKKQNCFLKRLQYITKCIFCTIHVALCNFQIHGKLLLPPQWLNGATKERCMTGNSEWVTYIITLMLSSLNQVV